MSDVEIALWHPTLIITLKSIKKNAHTSCHVMTDVLTFKQRIKTGTHTITEIHSRCVDVIEIQRNLYNPVTDGSTLRLHVKPFFFMMFWYLSQKKMIPSLKMNPWLDP